jgi:hypothetical protein
MVLCAVPGNERGGRMREGSEMGELRDRREGEESRREGEQRRREGSKAHGRGDRCQVMWRNVRRGRRV